MRISTTFAAVCTLMTASATLAADITIYGIVNTGLSYTSAEKIEGKTTRSLAMDSGNYLGSRFGIKGEEDLGGVHVGFVLENGFSSDTGTLSDGGRFFGREASLYVQSSDYGTLRFGRLTVMTGSTGTSGLMAGKFSAMSTGWGVVWGHNAVFAGSFGRMDNMIMYSTPRFAGLQLHVQYSSGIDAVTEKDGVENEGSVTRYMGIGAQYFNGPFSTIAIVDSHRYADTEDDPAITANLSFAYDFDIVKLYLAGQYFQDMRRLGKAAINSELSAANVFGTNVPKDGYALNLGFTAPLRGGKLYAALGWMDAEDSHDASFGMQRFTASVGYDYHLSKNTVLYGGVGYMLDMYDDFGVSYAASNENAANYGVTFGLSHRF